MPDSNTPNPATDYQAMQQQLGFVIQNHKDGLTPAGNQQPAEDLTSSQQGLVNYNTMMTQQQGQPGQQGREQQMAKGLLSNIQNPPGAS